MATAQFAPMGVTSNMFKSELDMDNLFDFNQGTSFSSPRRSSRPTARPIPTIYQEGIEDREDRQVFAGPSHEYDRFKQQTGVHVGDLSHLNQPMPSNFNQPYGGFNDMNMGGSWATGFDMDSDMNMDFGSSMAPTIIYPSAERSRSIDPASMDNMEEPQSNVGRLWPGMHQQQAMAKAHAQVQAPSSVKSRSRASSFQSDTHTEESISRLLNQMRQGSMVSTVHEDDDDVQDGFNPNIARMKKDDEDLDEDEKLLASDEGKKLSSKERRQLRNKVSARAFRSRRKEYISQLEGEIAVKTQEANQFKSENTKLADENSRYKDLIQFLLRQPSFAPVLEEISKDPSQTLHPSTAGPRPQQALQAAQAAQAAKHQQLQNMQNMPMNIMQEGPVDLSMLNLSNGLGNGLNNGYAMPQGMNFNNFR